MPIIARTPPDRPGRACTGGARSARRSTTCDAGPAPRARRPRALLTAFVFVAAIGALTLGCATIPRDRYGVDSLDFEGVEQLDPEALRACLATQERKRVEINIGASATPECNVPPFNGGRLRIPLWRWPWTTWPTLDLSVFERDLARVERWYRARGFYDARVLGADIEPPAASDSDRVADTARTPAGTAKPPCKRRGEGQGCTADITIRVFESAPVEIDAISIDGDEGLPKAVRQDVADSVALEVGGRFDEALYGQSKAAIVRTLQNETYACAEVTGDVQIDPRHRRAEVAFHVAPGPPTRVGDVRVEVNAPPDVAGTIPIEPIAAAAGLERGSRFSGERLADGQHAVFGLGAFATVEARSNPLRDAGGQCTGVVDVTIRVTPGRAIRYGVGVGLQSGVVSTTSTDLNDVPEWDGHLLLFFEHRNFLGGLRKLRIEERPRIVFRDAFPRPTTPSPGNDLRVELRQPGFLEPRTTLRIAAQWSLAPDPNSRERTLRHDLDASVGLSRPFFRGRLLLSGALHADLLVTKDIENTGYHLLFFQQYAQLDLRDDSRRPTKGVFLSVEAHEAGWRRASTWDYFRVTPEARGYVPLPLGMVLAMRFGVGAMFILRAADDPNKPNDLDPRSRLLGPSRYRLRGGGPTSHRGFVAGYLGSRDGSAAEPEFAPNDGGLRRWEASIELRAPLSESVGMVAFADFGDVNRGKRIRFNYLRTAVGLGLRYQTLVGPLRFDMGWLVPHAQVVGHYDADDTNHDPSFTVQFRPRGRIRFPGAWHLTIGEAF
ncbi:MAG: BamA/TamA family outer membrane protein [Myxococcales bacterium]|nr:BamA/TamA family outer membrane protein [Myxococcales bacterium]